MGATLELDIGPFPSTGDPIAGDKDAVGETARRLKDIDD